MYVPAGTLYWRIYPLAAMFAAVTPTGMQVFEGEPGVPTLEGLICQLLIESLMNLTEPSQKQKLAPPGWKLPGEATNSSGPRRVAQILPRLTLNGGLLNVFIPNIVQNIVSPKLPEVHQFQQLISDAGYLPW